MKRSYLVGLALPLLLLAAATFYLGAAQVGHPFPGFLPAANGIVSQLELPDWPGSAAGLRFNDRVISIETRPIEHGWEIWEHARSVGAGSTVTYTIARPDLLLGVDTMEVRVAVGRFGFADFVTVFLTAWGTGLGLCVCGLLLAALRPDDRSVRGFLAVALSSGVMLMTAFDYYTSQTLYRITPIASATFSGSVAHLGAILVESTFDRRRLRLLVTLTWGLAVVIGVGLELTMFSAFRPFVLFTRLVFLSLGLSIIAFTCASIVAAQTAPTVKERRRARIQAFGVGGLATIPLGAAMISAMAEVAMPVGLLAPMGLGVGLVVPYLLAALVDEDRVIRLIFRDRYEEYQALYRSLEERIRLRTAALNDAARELRLYYRALSHDLRRPVVNLANALKLGHADTVALPSSPDSQTSRELALRSAEEALTIVDGMLTAGRDVMRAEPKVRIDLAELIDEVVAELGDEIRRLGATIRKSGGPLLIRGERRKVAHAIRNVLRNALVYRAPDRSPRVAIDASKEADGRAIVAFSDNGIGIPPEYLERIFDGFFRVPSTTATRVHGAGVGLAVVREVMERHGGTVVVRSTVGQGSQFELRFPGFAPGAFENVLEGRRIYLIDDDPLCVFLTERGLAAAGAAVDSAGSGELGLMHLDASFSNRGPDAVVVDLMLPGIDGVAVCEELRRARGRSIPIILWSSADRTHAGAADEESGADLFLQKSDQMVEDLIDALARVFEGDGLGVADSSASVG